MTLETIPAIIRNLMAHKWNVSEVQFFENIFRPGDKLYGDRVSDPSFYVYRDGSSGLSGMTYEEALALAKWIEQEDFPVRARDPDKEVVSINEHVEHALSDFMSDVYRAWEKMKLRLDAIEAARAPLATFPEIKKGRKSR